MFDKNYNFVTLLKRINTEISGMTKNNSRYVTILNIPLSFCKSINPDTMIIVQYMREINILAIATLPMLGFKCFICNTPKIETNISGNENRFRNAKSERLIKNPSKSTIKNL